MTAITIITTITRANIPKNPINPSFPKNPIFHMANPFNMGTLNMKTPQFLFLPL